MNKELERFEGELSMLREKCKEADKVVQGLLDEAEGTLAYDNAIEYIKKWKVEG